MQIRISHGIKGKLILPINYHHILQSIIYTNMSTQTGVGDYFHDVGFEVVNRTFKLFTFGLLQGKYKIQGKNIIFYDRVSFEVRSPEILLLLTVSNSIRNNGIRYGNQTFNDVLVEVMDKTVEEEEILVRMVSPVCVYRTGQLTRETYYYEPWEDGFEELLNMNFKRKYEACFGVKPREDIGIMPVRVGDKDKYVTKYKGFYITAWRGVYMLVGGRRYLDFLYQTGLGTKNSQGFGMFEIITE